MPVRILPEAIFIPPYPTPPGLGIHMDIFYIGLMDYFLIVRVHEQIILISI